VSRVWRANFFPEMKPCQRTNNSFAPTNGEFKGVGNFAQKAKHVGAVNYMVGTAILEEKPPVNPGSENGPDSVKNQSGYFMRPPQPNKLRTLWERDGPFQHVPLGHRTVAQKQQAKPAPLHGHLSRYSILTWKVSEGSSYATAYHSPSGPITKYTSRW
jgi:hypothetical protein